MTERGYDMPHKLRVIIISMVFILAVAGISNAGTKVVIGELDWSGAKAIEEILAQVMEKYLDATVSRIAAAQPALYEAMDKGDGSVDIVADMWVDHLLAQMQDYVLPGSRETIILNKKPYLGQEGFFVPAYVYNELGVKKLSDLADPKVAKLFDIDDDGRGEMWPGALGWESANHTKVRGKSYGFDKYFDFTDLDPPILLAQLKDAYEQKKPIVFYYWTPDWIHAHYDLVMLQEPKFSGYTNERAKGSKRYNPNGNYTFYQPTEREDWFEASDIRCGQPPVSVYVAHSKALAERAPKISQFLRQVSFDTDIINQWILAMEIEKRDIKEVARDWIERNSEMIKSTWLKGISLTEKK